MSKILNICWDEYGFNILPCNEISDIVVLEFKILMSIYNCSIDKRGFQSIDLTNPVSLVAKCVKISCANAFAPIGCDVEANAVYWSGIFDQSPKWNFNSTKILLR